MCKHCGHDFDDHKPAQVWVAPELRDYRACMGHDCECRIEIQPRDVLRLTSFMAENFDDV